MKTVLLYRAECWKETDVLCKKLRTFVHRCLRTILKIRWQQHITNKEVRNRAGQENIITEIRKRRWKWLGHVLRKDPDDISREAVFWTPQGKRKKGRPKITWRRTMQMELNEAKITMKEAEKLARNRVRWRAVADATCATRHEED